MQEAYMSSHVCLHMYIQLYEEQVTSNAVHGK